MVFEGPRDSDTYLWRHTPVTTPLVLLDHLKPTLHRKEKRREEKRRGEKERESLIRPIRPWIQRS